MAEATTWVNNAKQSGQVTVTAADGAVNNINITNVISENLELKKRVARLEQEKAIKVELVHQCKYKTRETAKQNIFQYIEGYYNRKRMHSAIDYMTPSELELVA